MIPKDMASELLEKFRATGISYFESKQCALIAVDEIIGIMDKVSDIETNYFDSAFTGNFINGYNELKNWQKVSEELNKI